MHQFHDTITLIKIHPVSETFKIIPSKKVIIDKVNFANQDASVSVQSSDKSKIEIRSINVHQGLSGKIHNAKNTGKITFALLSNLEINEFINLGFSTLDFSK